MRPTAGPYVRVHAAFSVLLMLYVSWTSFLVPLWSLAKFSEAPLALERTLTEILVGGIILWPLFLINRHDFGWLHPFILPSLYKIAKAFAKNTDDFFLQFVPHPFPILNNVGMTQLSQTEVVWAQIHHDLVIGLSWLIIYGVFYATSGLKVPKIRLHTPRLLVPKLLAVASLGVIVGGYVIWKQGGIEASIYAMGFGRFRQREALGGGHFTVFSTLLTIAVFVWFAYRRKAQYKPVFLLLLLLSLGLDFIQTGSRSGLLYQFIVLFCIYIIRERKVPALALGVVGVSAVLFFGVLGQLRKSSNTGERVAWEVLTSTSLEERLEIGKAQVDLRPNGTFLVMGESMERTGPLWGRTYVGIFTFFVPRFIWPDKPRGAGAYAASLLLYNQDLKRVPAGGKGQSIPVSWQAEAFWNFHLPGIIAVGVLTGLFYRFFANLFTRYPRQPIIWLLYIYSIMNFSPRSDGAIVFIQDLILLLLVAILIQAWRPLLVRFHGA